MKPRDHRPLNTRRNAPSGSRFKFLNQVVRKKRRKLPASTATGEEFEDEGEIPGVGVARGLLVILLLHVAAAGGIALHGKWAKQEAPAAKSQKGEEAKGPVLIDGAQHYVVQYGDNYYKIAAAQGVSLDELKQVNQNVEIAPGIKINIPVRKVAPLPTEMSGPVARTILPPVERPSLQLDDLNQVASRVPGELLEAEGAPAEVDQAVFIEPQRLPVPSPSQLAEARRQAQIQAQARQIQAVPPVQAPPAARGRSHKIQKGDTIWRISRKYGVDQDELMRINGISDPGRIRLGAVLKIPN